METRAKIIKINMQRLMVAALTNQGISIFELYRDQNIDVGDNVGWFEDAPTGDTTIMNYTKNEKFDVHFQNHFVDPKNVDAQLLIK